VRAADISRSMPDSAGGSVRFQLEKERRMLSTAKTKRRPKVELQPLGDRVVVRPLEEAEEMRGGLYIPDTAKEKPLQGEIVAVGPGRFEKGERIPMEVKVGQKVLYSKYAGTDVRVGDEEVLIIKESDVLAVVE
jgi:chaperonin GroES